MNPLAGHQHPGGSAVKQLSGMDTAFLRWENRESPMVVGSLVIYGQGDTSQGAVRFKEILEHIRARLPLAKCFRQRLVAVPFDLDRPYWLEDEGFDLEYHVRHLALPKPGDWRQLCIQTARLLARPLDMTRPLWEMTVVEGLDHVEGFPRGSYAIVTKIHHAAIDGVSGAEIFAALHDLEGFDRDVPADTWRPERAPGELELLARAGLHSVRQPLEGFKAVAGSLPAIGEVVRSLQRHDLTLPTPLLTPTRFNEAVTPHRVVGGQRFALDDLKAVRRAVDGATVNDVVLSLVGGALRHYLDHHGELPETPLIAMAPISKRRSDQQKDEGNLVSSMLVTTGSNVADPLARVATVAAATKEGKALDGAIGARALTDFVTYGPLRMTNLAARAVVRSGLVHRTGVAMHTVVTNVPGPQAPLTLGRSPVLALFGLGPITDGLGLFHPVLSYNGQVSVSFTADRTLLPDPDFYAQCLTTSFRDLTTAASGTQR